MTGPTFPLRMNARELQARNLVASRGRGLAPALQPATEFDLVPLAASDGDVQHGLGEAEIFALEWGGARFVLAFPRAALNDWLDVRLRTLGYAGAEISGLGPAWRHTARTLASDWLLAALAGAGRGQARLAVDESADAGCAHVFALEARFAPRTEDAAATVLHGRVACDGLGLMLMSGLLAERAVASAPLAGVERRLRYTVPVSLGHTDLPLARVRALARRDVILITRPAADAGGVFHLSLPLAGGGAYGLRARVEDGALIPLDRLTLTMSDQDENAAVPDAAPALSLEQLPVRLSFDLGCVTMTLAELEALQPGQAIALARPLGGAVTIRANGATIGHGELVDIDGRAGVSVLELFPPEGAAPETGDDAQDA